MDNSNLDAEVSINKDDIDDIYIDAKRNITVSLKGNKKIIIERGKSTKKVYNYLSGYYAEDD